MTKRKFQIIFTFFCLALLFLFPTHSFEGAKKGLLLWFNVVLPTLLPFLIFTNLMFQLHITKTFSIFLYPVFKHLMPISEDGCYPIAIGLLSGYPMGAKACADMVNSGKISTEEGQFLLAFCNNASPMFLLNYMLIQSLHIQTNLFIYMGILVGSSLLCGYFYFLTHKSYFYNPKTNRTTPSLSYSKNSPYSKNKQTKRTFRSKNLFFSAKHPFPHIKKETSTVADYNQVSVSKPTYFQILDRSIMNAFEIITKIGGYIILFSLLANLMTSLVSLPELPKALLIGTLEITTGLQYIESSALSQMTKILLAMTLSAFGGLSSVAQTGSVLLGSPLKLTTYVTCKLISSIICFLLIFLYLSLF